MKIAILTTQAPFIRGGAEMHAENLERELKKRGHEAEIVSLPFKGHPPQSILDQMLAARATDLSDCVPKIDLVICLKFPAWYVKHPNKVYWILHQHRDAYDLWDRGLSDLLHHDTGPVTRDAITVADTHEFKHAKRLFANSQNVADRLQRYNGIQAQPLYHPPPGWEDLRAGQTGAYIYYPSRIGPMKRQSLVIDALAHADPSVRIVFSGAPDNPEYLETLQQRAEELGVDNRITWKGFITREDMIDLYANCAGVVFPPVDEDLGYITLEAMLCEKPVVTTTDAGEPARIIRDGIEGFVAEPTPQALGSALSKLMQKPERMGQAARQRFDSMNISWDYAIEQLIGQAQQVTPKVKADKKDTTKEKVLPSDYTPQRNITEYWKGRLHSTPFQALREFAAPALETARRTLVITSQKPENPSFGSWISLQEQDLEHTEISYPDQYFDTVLMDQSLEKLLHNPAYVLYQLRRVLKPNGSVVILTPDAEKDRSKQVFDPSGLPPLARYTREMLEILLSGLGYQVQQIESWKINDEANGLFVLAKKQEMLENPQILQKLYHNDPGQLMAKLEQMTSDDPSVITVRAQNTGWSNWTPQTICLTVYRKDSMGQRNAHLCVLLTQDVMPDESADFIFQVHETCEGIDSPRWILELCQIDRQTMRVVPISGSGLAHPIVLLANTVTPYHVAA